LIIEDNEREAAFLGKSLPDFSVEYAASFGIARELLKRNKYDLVIADLGLPDCSRIEAAAWIYALAGSSVFVIITGSGQDRDGFMCDAFALKYDLQTHANVSYLVAKAFEKRSGVKPLQHRVSTIGALANLLFQRKPKAA
jgi:CheY-like chemotaxis protein